MVNIESWVTYIELDLNLSLINFWHGIRAKCSYWRKFNAYIEFSPQLTSLSLTLTSLTQTHGFAIILMKNSLLLGPSWILLWTSWYLDWSVELDVLVPSDVK